MQRYRPGTAVGRSHGSPQLGHSGPSLTDWAANRIRLTRAAAQPRDEKAVGPVAVRKELEMAPCERRPPARMLGAEVVRLPAILRAQEVFDQLLALTSRDRADRVDQDPAGLGGASAAGEDPRLERGEL